MNDTLLAFTGDEAAAGRLRDSLRRIAADTADPDLRRDLQAVLNGRLDVRALIGDSRLEPLVARGVAMFEEAWAALTPEERASAVDAAKRSVSEKDD
jgi:hypothetical protein